MEQNLLVGPYVEVSRICVGQSEKLIPVFIPSLAALLNRFERDKGVPLTREEVMRIRDDGVCMMLPQDVARELEDSRGYGDVAPENCWEEWNAIRGEFEGGKGEA